MDHQSLKRLILFIFFFLLPFIFVSHSRIVATASDFEALTEDQKEAALALLKEATAETKVDPLEIIKRGLEQVKEDGKQKLVGMSKSDSDNNEESQVDEEKVEETAEEVGLSKDNEVEDNIVGNEGVSGQDEDGPSNTKPKDVHVEDDSEASAPVNQPDAISHPTALNSSVNTEDHDAIDQDTSDSHVNLHHAEPLESDLVTPAPTTTTTTSSVFISEPQQGTPASPTVFSAIKPLIKQDEQRKPLAQDDIDGLKQPATTLKTEELNEYATTELPTEQQDSPIAREYEDTYIDNSDPNNPQKVHIRNKTISKVDGNGGFMEQSHQSMTSNSLDNNPYRRTSSSSHSSSASSFSTNSSPISGGFSSDRNGFTSQYTQNFNGQPIVETPTRWVYNQINRRQPVQIASARPMTAIPLIAPIPPIPPIPPMTSSSFSAFNMLPAYNLPWASNAASFYRGNGRDAIIEQTTDGFVDGPRINFSPYAYASTFPGLPPTMQGYFPGYISKRQAKKMRKAAARLQMQ